MISKRLTLRSHTLEEIQDADKTGLPIYALDTGNDGGDDTLIGTKEEILIDLCNYYDIREIPAYWTLERVN